MPLETNFLVPDASFVMWIVILSIATPALVTVLVLVLVRLLWKRAESVLPTSVPEPVPAPMAATDPARPFHRHDQPPPPAGPPVG